MKEQQQTALLLATFQKADDDAKIARLIDDARKCQVKQYREALMEYATGEPGPDLARKVLGL